MVVRTFMLQLVAACMREMVVRACCKRWCMSALGMATHGGFVPGCACVHVKVQGWPLIMTSNTQYL